MHVLLQSFDLQRVLEGEKALRSEATRQLKEVEKKLVSLRSPAVALSSPMPAPPGSERTLEADKAMLQDQIKAHSAQVPFVQHIAWCSHNVHINCVAFGFGAKHYALTAGTSWAKGPVKLG